MKLSKLLSAIFVTAFLSGYGFHKTRFGRSGFLSAGARRQGRPDFFDHQIPHNGAERRAAHRYLSRLFFVTDGAPARPGRSAYQSPGGPE